MVHLPSLRTGADSRADEDLECLPSGHGAVAVGYLVQADGAVEDPARLNAAVEDVGQQVLDVRAGGGDAAGHGDVAPDGVEAQRHLAVLGGADPADRAAVAHDAEGYVDGLLGADAFQHGVGAVAAGQLPDLGDAFLAAFGDDVGGAELAAEFGAVGVPAGEDDAFGAESFGGEHGGQADRAVADHGH